MKKNLLVFIMACFLPINHASAASFTNGSFEINSYSSLGSFIGLSAGSTSIYGWDISDGGVDYIHTYWDAADGDFSLDMARSAPGTISQTFDTVLNHTYKVTFSLSGNFHLAPAIKNLLVSAGNSFQTYTFDSTTATTHNMGWVDKEFTFTAADAYSTLTFKSISEGAAGPALDNVRVVDLGTTPAPEPSSFILGLMGLSSFLGLKRKK